MKKAQTGTGSNLDDTDQEAMASDQSSSSEEEPTQDETSRSGTDES